MTASATGRPRALIVAALFSPSRLIGARRPERMAMQLVERGWDVTVLTRPPHRMEPIDPEVPPPRGVEIVRARAPEPSTWIRRAARSLRGSPPGGGPGAPRATETAGSAPAPGRADRWLRPLEFPDPLSGWRLFAPGAVRGRHFDLVLATLPPFSTAVVGRAVARAARIPLVLDYRDPWTESPGVVAAAGTPPAVRARHRALEDRCLADASLAIAATRTLREILAARTSHPVVHLPNAVAGPSTPPATAPGDGSIVYLGSLSYGRDLAPVLRALAASRGGSTAAPRLVYAGPHGEALRAAAREAGVEALVDDRGSVSHADALSLLRGGSAGIVLVSEGYDYALPGKLFEVISTGRPVLLLAPRTSEASDLVRRRRLGWPLAPDDAAGVLEALRALSRGEIPMPLDLEDYGYEATGALLDRELRSVLAAAAAGGITGSCRPSA